MSEFCYGLVVVTEHHETIHPCDVDKKTELAFNLTAFILNCNKPSDQTVEIRVRHATLHHGLHHKLYQLHRLKRHIEYNGGIK
ncbi:hypothetical protein DsansV1_C09g0096641 [Dioscorea sansibarensis]